MNILLVSSYPPMACGIAKYAEDQAASLRRDGHRVDVLAPEQGDGDFSANLVGGLRPLRLLKYLWAYDQSCIHFAVPFFYNPHHMPSRMMTSVALLLVTLLFGRRILFIIHEMSFQIGQKDRGRLRHRIDRWYWRLAKRVIFHSRIERDAFAAFYRLKPERKAFEVWPQEKYLARRCTLTREQARQSLGVALDDTMLLCIGFIQPHKGYERALFALRQVPDEKLRLCIVGSLRDDSEHTHAYLRELHDQAGQDSRCQVIEGYLSDERFDAWFVAADYVMIPYYEIWTSAVAARAKLYGRPLIAARTGALVEQLSAGSVTFANDEELTEVLRRISRQTGLKPAGQTHEMLFE